MTEAVCPHCNNGVYLGTMTTGQFECPACRGIFEFEADLDEFAELERELASIQPTKKQISNSKNRSKGSMINETKSTVRSTTKQNPLDIPFDRDYDSMRLTSVSILDIILNPILFVYRYYLALTFLMLGILGFSFFIVLVVGVFIGVDILEGFSNGDLLFAVFALPISMILGHHFGLKTIISDWSDYSKTCLFLHPTRKTLELTGKKKFGLGLRRVIHRISISESTSIRPGSSTYVWEGEGGGSHTTYFLTFSDQKSWFKTECRYQDWVYIQDYLESKYKVKILKAIKH